MTETPFVHDENPKFSPDGKKIIWNTAAGDPDDGEELWIMNADGNKVRLTYFTAPNHSEYDPIARQITEITWSPDGKSVVFGHVSREERGSPHLPSTLYLLTFEESCGGQAPPYQSICGNGICEERETKESCQDTVETFSFSIGYTREGTAKRMYGNIQERAFNIT